MIHWLCNGRGGGTSATGRTSKSQFGMVINKINIVRTHSISFSEWTMMINDRNFSVQYSDVFIFFGVMSKSDKRVTTFRQSIHNTFDNHLWTGWYKKRCEHCRIGDSTIFYPIKFRFHECNDTRYEPVINLIGTSNQRNSNYSISEGRRHLAIRRYWKDEIMTKL